MSNGLKILMMAGSVVITCVVISLGFFLTREGKNKVNEAVGQFGEMLSEYQDLDLMLYDDAQVTGSEVRKVITEVVANKRLLAVCVTTAAGDNAYYNYYFDESGELVRDNTGSLYLTEPVENRTSEAYINPHAMFRGSVVYNENKILIALKFHQMG